MARKIDYSYLSKAQMARLKIPGIKPVVCGPDEALGVARTKRGAALVLCQLADCSLAEALEIVREEEDCFAC